MFIIHKSLVFAFGFVSSSSTFFSFTLWVWFLFFLWFLLFLFIFLFFFLVIFFNIIIIISISLITFMLNAQIVFQTVWKNFIDKHSSDFEIIIKSLSLFEFLFVGLNISDSWGFQCFEEIEEWFCFNWFGDYSLLSCLFIFLFLLHFLDS